MLDKKTARFLARLNHECHDGSYKIIEKAELLNALAVKAGASASALDPVLRFLQDNELIDVKYTDETVCCLTVLPKGRVAVENRDTGTGVFVGRDGKRAFVWVAAIAFAAAFLGALVGNLIAGLIS